MRQQLFLWILCTYCFFGNTLIFAQTTRALLIAVPECKGFGSLPSKNDAERLKATLLERNKEIEVRLLTPGIEEPTRENIKNAILNWLLKERKENDTIIIYFSGHGYVDPKNPNATYLVTSDFDLEFPETGLPITGIHISLERCKAKQKFLIIDSCHSGANTVGPELNLDKQLNVPGVITLASSMFGEKSLVCREREMSLFSYWLNEGLKGHADKDNDGTISIDELYKFVHDHVVLNYKHLSRTETQTPVRIIGPTVAGVPNITRLEPTDLDMLLDDIAKQIVAQLRWRQYNQMGVLDFTIESRGTFSQAKEQYELLQLYCVKKIEQRVNELKKDSYTVYDHVQTWEAITKSVHNSLELNQIPLPLEIVKGKPPVRVLLSGNILGRLDNQKVHLFNIQCQLQCHQSDPEGLVVYTIAGGTATLSQNIWGMIGLSANLMNVDLETSPQALISQLDTLADQPHPLLDGQFPFRVELWVKDPETDQYIEQREPVVVNNRVYYPMKEGDVYQIRLASHLEGRTFAAKVLVDGLNTFPEKLKENEYEYAKRVSLEHATAWGFSRNKPLYLNGFYTKPTARTPAEYYEFEIGRAEESLAAAKSYTRQIGLITIGIYEDLTQGTEEPITRGGTNFQSSGPALGTKGGKQQTAEIEVTPSKAGKLLAVLHLRYDSQENIDHIKKLQSQFSISK